MANLEVVGGRYRIERQLGAGGFGVVYLATQLPLGRPVAVKVLQQSGPEANARFSQEAALAQRLEHPHTVRLLDFGIADGGLPFIVWEYLRGKTLGEHLSAQGPLPLELARRVAVQVLKSLMEAHAMGIIHRDIKPANIFLTTHPGEPVFAKVLDFGIAKDLFAPGNTLFEAPNRTLQLASYVGKPSPLTSASSLLGTPRYMSPEQARSGAVGPDTDLFALGLVMSEMLTGRHVFGDEDAFDVLISLGSDGPVPIPALVAASPLGPAILRATQKNRELRFHSAAEMLAHLEASHVDARVAHPFHAPQTLGQSSPHGAGSRTYPSHGVAVPEPHGAAPHPTAVAPLERTVRHLETPRPAPPHAAVAARPSNTPWIIATVALILAAGSVGWLALSRDTRVSRSREAASTHTADGSEKTSDPLEPPPPPKVDWAQRKVLSFDATKIRAALTQAGYDVRKEDRLNQDGFSMVTFTVAKPPCGGSVNSFTYGDAAIAEQAFKTLQQHPSNFRVLREGNSILQVALARSATPEGDAACTDPAAVALTR